MKKYRVSSFIYEGSDRVTDCTTWDFDDYIDAKDYFRLSVCSNLEDEMMMSKIYSIDGQDSKLFVQKLTEGCVFFLYLRSYLDREDVIEVLTRNFFEDEK